jgi:hypothetical protein
VLTGEVKVTNGTLAINEGIGLTAASLDNAGTLTLSSVSTSYSSLIVSSVSSNTGTINYERYVNVVGSGTTGDNDLVSAPLTGQQVNNFAAANSNLPQNGDNTQVGFGIFNNETGNYENYAPSDTDPLTAATGYRAATTGGGTLIFTGTVQTGNIDKAITDEGGTFGRWNLIGNPYPSYLDMSAFLNHDTGSGVKNIDLLDSNSAAIYGYNGADTSVWDIITLANVGTRLMAPGQGFFVAAPIGGSSTLQFRPTMRVTGSSDDFIPNSDPNSLTFLKLELSNTQSTYKTDFYFNANSSLGLDPGYDAQAWGGLTTDFMLYSLLVNQNTGLPIALQSLNSNDLANVSIPLGVNANAGEEITFSIAEYALPDNTEVYLEDTVAQTSVLLNAADYSLTPATDLSGTGRFFLNFNNQTLSVEENTLEDIIVYVPQFENKIMVQGILNEGSTAAIYDVFGRQVHQTELLSHVSTQAIEVANLSAGMYIVKLQNGNQTKTHKVILK